MDILSNITNRSSITATVLMVEDQITNMFEKEKIATIAVTEVGVEYTQGAGMLHIISEAFLLLAR